MRIGLLQLPSGIAGDMLLGALLDAGADLAAVNAALHSVSDGRLEVTVHPVQRAGLRGLRAHVQVDGAVLQEAGGPLDDTQAHAHDHEATHAADSARLHPHAASHTPTSAPDHHHRAFADIRSLIERADLDPEVRVQSLAVFRRLAEVEGARHGIAAESVHFHEVGGWDAIGDIVGVSAALHSLALDTLYHGPIAVGGGSVQAAHGELPVPAPATLELLAGRDCRFESGAGELTTPTGAALVTTLAVPAPTRMDLTPVAVGYGAGRANPSARANLVRLLVGEQGTTSTTQRTVSVLETSLDDFTPQDAGHLLQLLLDHGALDATLSPLIMKKSRPGFLLRVIALPEHEDGLTQMVLSRSSTLGVRVRREERRELSRVLETIVVDSHAVRLKVAQLPDGSRRAHAEYDDLASLVVHTGETLAAARARVEAAWRETQ